MSDGLTGRFNTINDILSRRQRRREGNQQMMTRGLELMAGREEAEKQRTFLGGQQQAMFGQETGERLGGEAFEKGYRDADRAYYIERDRLDRLAELERARIARGGEVSDKFLQTYLDVFAITLQSPGFPTTIGPGGEEIPDWTKMDLVEFRNVFERFVARTAPDMQEDLMRALDEQLATIKRGLDKEPPGPPETPQDWRRQLLEQLERWGLTRGKEQPQPPPRTDIPITGDNMSTLMGVDPSTLAPNLRTEWVKLIGGVRDGTTTDAQVEAFMAKIASQVQSAPIQGYTGGAGRTR